jgi:hypothetical protein
MSEQELVKRRTDGQCEIIWDHRYLPILIGHVVGEANMSSVDFFFSVRDAALMAAAKEGQKIVVVSDMTRYAMPPATIRKALGERAKNDPNMGSILGYVNVVPNALLRGMVTAIQWLVGDGLRPVKVVGSLPDGIKASIQMLANAGIDLDANSFLKRYEPPSGL